MSLISVPVSFGELLDKFAILEIKSERMSDPAKLANVRRELDELRTTWGKSEQSKIDIADLLAALKAVNERLWVIEDDIRIKESKQEFDAEFIRLARAVYFENDERARVKREINVKLGSILQAHDQAYVVHEGHPADADEAWLMYQDFVASGLEIDHLCRMPACLYVDHHEPVTPAENCTKRGAPGVRPVVNP